MKNKSLQIRKENIFTKFINFIKKMFKKKSTLEPTLQEGTTHSLENSKPDFFEKFGVHQEAQELLKLQNQFEKSEIDLCTMSNEEIHELNSLYKRQIAELTAKLANKKVELNRIQYRLKKQSSNN